MPDPLEEIKQKIDIVDLVSSYISLKKAGRNFKALCPFHQEKTPSFFVSPEKQIWHCFGCGRGGDAISFVMEMEGLDFYDALKFLGEKVGVKVEPVDKEAYSEKKRLYEVNEIAAKFYQYVLWKTEPGKRALKYLRDRGLKDETIDEFHLGYAPNQKDALSQFLLKRKYPVPLLVRSGLVIKKDNPSPNEVPIFDRFRGRVMFPIFNQAGSIVGFSGRIMPEWESDNLAKYLNSPDTPIFNKSFVLYGLNFAKQEIIKKGYVVLVEGQMDVISSHQAGFKNTVASSGTSLTGAQLDLLRRFTDKIYFAFDQDSAGQIATERGIELALKKGFLVYVVFVPKPFKDVDECVRADRKKWKQALKDKRRIIEYFFEIYAQKAKTIEERREAAEKILPWIKIIPDPILQGEWVKKLSAILEIGEPYLYEALSELELDKQKKVGLETPEKGPSKEEIAKRLVGFLFVFPSFYRKTRSRLNEVLAGNKLYKMWLKFYNQKDKFDKGKDKFLARLKDPSLSLAVLEIENDYETSEKDLAWQEFQDLLQFLQRQAKEIQIARLQRQIKLCEQKKDTKRLKKLLQKLQNLILDK